MSRHEAPLSHSCFLTVWVSLRRELWLVLFVISKAGRSTCMRWPILIGSVAGSDSKAMERYAPPGQRPAESVRLWVQPLAVKRSYCPQYVLLRTPRPQLHNSALGHVTTVLHHRGESKTGNGVTNVVVNRQTSSGERPLA